MAKPVFYTFLLFLFCLPHFSASLQVTPNSPCAPVCQDSPDLDVSDRDSSTTTNSDITCEDADYSRAAGTKFKKCMACLQTSTYSRGGESDTMWFLYNLRYTAAYCVFGYPDATNFSPTPCTTRTACGYLEANMRHGIPDPEGTTAYSYCLAGDGNAMDFSLFEGCIACTSALGTTNYLANFFAALGIACQQQPAPGRPIRLNDTIFTHAPIGPESDDDDGEGSWLGAPAVVGIITGVLVFLLLSTGITLVCLRKRRERYLRAGARTSYNLFPHHRSHSSMSFPRQTDTIPPRSWPRPAQDGVPTPTAETSSNAVPAAISSSSAGRAAPLQIATATAAPARPPRAHASPETPRRSPCDFCSPLPAATVAASSALLPPCAAPSPPSAAAPAGLAGCRGGGGGGLESASASASASGLGLESESGFALRLGTESTEVDGSGGGKGVVGGGSSGRAVESRTMEAALPAPLEQ
ncbi:hypothetical protein VTH06DRAFT_1276 [Thermothelomyces fergusii]